MNSLVMRRRILSRCERLCTLILCVSAYNAAVFIASMLRDTASGSLLEMVQ